MLPSGNAGCIATPPAPKSLPGWLPGEMTALPAPDRAGSCRRGPRGGSPGPGAGAALSRAGPAKARISRENRDFLQCAGQRLTARLMVTGEQMAGKPRRNDEPPRDAGRTGSAGSHRPARRRYRRRVQLRPGSADQRAEHPGAFLTQGNQRPVPGRIRTWMSSPLLHESAARRKPAPARRARVSAKARQSWTVTLCYTAAPTARRGRHPSNGPGSLFCAPQLAC